MSEKTLNGTDKVPYELYHKLENEIFALIDKLESIGVRGSDDAKAKAINIRFLQQSLIDAMSKGEFTAEGFKVVNEVIERWKRS